MRKFLPVTVILCLIAVFLIPTSAGVAFADSVYSDALEDLQVDKNFNIDDYPISQTDFSLKLIQLAESKANELLAYVYQPSAGKFGVLAKKIRIFVSDSYQDFNLTYLTNHGQFYKYKVDGYVTDVTSTVCREYSVVQLMRSADERCGDKLVDENNNKISFIPYPVGYKFSVTTKDNVVYYGKSKSDYSVVTDKYCGQLQFNNPINKLYWLTGASGAGMLHFIAFNGVGIINEDGSSREIQIEELQEADVAYTLVCHEMLESYQAEVLQGGIYNKDISEERITKTLDATTSDSYQAGIFAHEYSWKEIMTVEDFINDVVDNDSSFFNSKLAPASVDEIRDKQFVLILCVTEITHLHTSGDSGAPLHIPFETTKDTRYYVNDETILRLQFETQGKVYNLGTVDNYQTGDGVPDNTEDYGFNDEWWKNLLAEIEEWIKIFAIIVGVVILVVLAVFVAPFIWKIIKFIAKIIVAPFKFLFGGRSKRRSGSSKYKKR